VVNCGGQWAKALADQVGVTVPLYSAEHYYIVTEAIEGLTRTTPTLRDPDGYSYFKEEVRGLLIGGFEPDAKPWVPSAEIPEPFEFQLLPEDWDQFDIIMRNAVHRVPVVENTGVKKFYNGPESFTPDHNFIRGLAPELDNYYVLAGFDSSGIAFAGGAGAALARWIVDGDPGLDLSAVDIRRFAPMQGNSRWLRQRVQEIVGLHFAMAWPNREPESAAEHLAARSEVALFDQTSFAKVAVRGPDAEAALQFLCTNDVAIPPGRTVYTGLLNDRGGYEADVTITRLRWNEYLLVTSSAQGVHDLDLLRRGGPARLRAEFFDVTSSYAVLSVMGPRSRALLRDVSSSDFSASAFPFGHSRDVDLSGLTVRATRLTYVGELGWELYVPSEMAVAAFERLTEGIGSGQAVTPRLAGYYAIESLRLEKGYRAFGRELGPDTSPVEAGLAFTCKLSTAIPFRGREAVERHQARGVSRRLVSMVVSDPSAYAWGGELHEVSVSLKPPYDRSGTRIRA
jgi:glycine cleavage system aminomethyltransferase T